MGHEAVHSTIIDLPVIIMAYNLFINGVERYDQLQASHTIARGECKLPIDVFTFHLHAIIQSGYALY